MKAPANPAAARSAHGSFNAETELGLVINGVLDVVFAFAMTLERKGVMSRSEIATMLRFVTDQATVAQGGRTKRTLIAEMMIEVFETPIAGEQVRERWRVLDGGRPAEASAAAAPSAEDDDLPPAA